MGNMTAKPSVVAIGAVLLSAAIAPSLRAATAVSALPVAQIVERNVAARGGLTAWRSVRTLSMSGTMDAGRVSADPQTLVDQSGVPGRPRKRLRPEASPAKPAEERIYRLPYLIEMKRPHKMRFELQVKNDTAVQMNDGSQGWKLRPYLGRKQLEPFDAQEMKLAATQQELDGPLVDYVAKGTQVRLEGVEKIDGHDAYRLALTLKTGEGMHVWVDSLTFLDVKFDQPRHYGGKERAVATYLRDFRNVQGLMIPFQLENEVAGVRGAQKIEVQQVAINPQLADSRFTKPL
jgi:hypothetical protein